MKLFSKLKSNLSCKKEEKKVFSTLESIIDAREERGDSQVVDAHELWLLKNIFRLRDVRVRMIMRPRVEIDAVPLDMPPSKFYKYIMQERFTRYPVYDGNLDNVVGVVHVKDVLAQILAHKKCRVSDVVKRNILFVSPFMRALDLLKEMQSKKIQIALIVDEHGSIDGLVSLEDLLEVIVGQIEDEDDACDNKEMLKRVDVNTVEVHATMKLNDFETQVGPVLLQGTVNPEIDTIGGFVADLAGHLPEKGEVIQAPNCPFKFVVLQANARQIQKISAQKLEKQG